MLIPLSSSFVRRSCSKTCVKLFQGNPYRGQKDDWGCNYKIIVRIFIGPDLSKILYIPLKLCDVIYG